MYTKSRRLRYTSLLLVASLFLGLSASPAAADNVTGGEGKPILSGYDRNNTYGNYIAKYKMEKAPDVELKIPASAFAESRAGDARVMDYKDSKNVLNWKTDQAGSWVEWDVMVPQTGRYQMAIRALIPQSNPRDIEFGLQIDGKTPFNEAGNQVMSRVWMDDGGITQSSAGHDIRPKPVVIEKWMDYGFHDSDGRYGEDFQFYLTQGTHKIRLKSDYGELLLQYLKVYRMPAVTDYKQMAAVYKEKGYKPAVNQFIKVQAENSDSKSNSDLSPISDRSSSATEPYDAYKIKLNTIGGPNWKRSGQWISWILDVPENGLYQLSIKYRQNLLSGLFTSRRIYIDEKVPFREWEHVRFPFGNDWGIRVPGDKEPELVYLEKGKHELKMEVVLGEISDSINQIDDAIYELNDLYRRIIMITSTHPDPYRDYYIDERVPDMVELLQNNGRHLADQAGKLAEVSGKKGSEVALLETISHQLTDIADKPETIATRLDSFKSNVSALASWSARVKDQPLELDYIELLSLDQEPKSANESFPQKIWRTINQFVASFVVDYDSIGNKDAKAKSSVKVWVGTGRDQAAILKNLIDNYFTPQTGVSVDLQLVQGSIIEATLAGKGPDIALMQPNGEPVNFALRGALVDLSKFRDFGEVSKRFYDSALVPFQYLNGYYAIPEMQMYDMMFYRKDVFDQLGLKVPDTWEDFYKILPVITRNNMNVGFNQDMFATFLFQYGGTYYNKSLTQTAFDTPEAEQAFADLTNVYTRYDFPLTYDFYSRFRTGEMPVAFQPFTQFNLLSVASPELNGLWDMAPYPGFIKPDGTIDRSQHATSTASIMFNKTKDKDAAWEFLKWWSSADIQAKYGKDLEMLMGPAARYPTANIEAFKQLPWAQKERENIMKQWEHVKGIPEAPGSYYTGVGITNAFKAATVDYKKAKVPANPYQALSEWNHMINDELKRKRIEFGLPTE